ncbi:MAG: hypothetical protein QOH12_2870 [Solirubrobacteraceae bacterium]|jgi:hypothetical protein|nr:hypothetical protein [Solirubrobacteraceae bacterium]
MIRWDETWHRLQAWTNGQGPSERLASQLLLAEGYTEVDPSHPLGGPDGGKDAIATKGDERWVMATYFPRGQQRFSRVRRKLVDDVAGVAANGADGIVFVTNQELALDERDKLAESVSVPLDLFHLERLMVILDSPEMAGVREQFLGIPAVGSPAMQRRLSRLSQIALDDADRIGPDRQDASDSVRTVRLSDELYVARPEEDVIVSAIARGRGMVLLVGEPGTGKTSLLWRLHGLLDAHGHDAYFVRATLLRLDDGPGPGPSPSNLVEAATAARRGDRKCVFLIDTADARLHDDAERISLLLMLAELGDAGAQLIVSSRPREAEGVDEALGARRVELGGYGDALEEAVRRHITRYYRAGAAEIGEAVSDVMSAVARGRPVRALLDHPLRLRMLFETYAPFQILEEEIDTPTLYDAFWDRRVRRDLRPGAPPGEPGSKDDVSQATRRIARALLALGGPEQPMAGVETALERLGGTAEDVPRLRQRGLLNADTDVVAFFHQTFFEYATARDFLEARDLRPEQLSIRATERPNDGLLAAVHEQLLVRASGHEDATASRAEQEVLAMLTSSHSSRQQSGVYAYAAWRRGSTVLDEAVDRLLETADRDLVAAFVRLSPGAPASRIGAILARLATAWRVVPRQRAGMLVQLARLAPRSPEATLAWLHDVDAIGGLLERPEVAAKEARLWAATVLSAAESARLNGEPALDEAAWGLLVDWTARVLRTRDISARAAYDVIKALATNDYLPAPAIAAQRLHDAVGAVSNRWRVDPLLDAFGLLWERQWHHTTRHPRRVLAELENHSSFVGLCQLRGAGHYLAASTENVDIVAALLALPLSRRWGWVSGLLPRVLDNPQSPTGHAAWSALRAHAAEPPRPGDRRLDVGVMLREALERTTLAPGEFAAQLATAPGLGDTTPWFDVKRMAEHLARAAVGGHGGAKQALEELLAGHTQPSDALNAAVSRELRRLAAAGIGVAGALALDLAVVTRDIEDAELACALLRHSPEILDRRVPELGRIWHEGSESHLPKVRRAAMRILDSLIDAGLETGVSMAWLRQHLRQTSTEQLWPLMSITERLANAGRLPAREAISALEPRDGMESHVVDRARVARLSIAVKRPDLFSAELVLEMALAAPSTPECAGLLADRLIDLAEDDATEALALLMKWLERPGRSEIGLTRSSKDVASALRPAVRRIAAQAAADSAVVMLELASTTDEAMAEVICAALTQRSEVEIRGRLDHELRRGRLPDKALGALRANLRRVPSEGWPELLGVLTG